MNVLKKKHEKLDIYSVNLLSLLNIHFNFYTNRHENEKEALLNRLRGVDSQYLSEKERQAELAKLKREQRRVQQEEKFGAASLVIGIAEQNQAAVQEKY